MAKFPVLRRLGLPMIAAGGDVKRMMLMGVMMLIGQGVHGYGLGDAYSRVGYERRQKALRLAAVVGRLTGVGRY